MSDNKRKKAAEATETRSKSAETSATVLPQPSSRFENHFHNLFSLTKLSMHLTIHVLCSLSFLHMLPGLCSKLDENKIFGMHGSVFFQQAAVGRVMQKHISPFEILFASENVKQ